MFSYLRPSNFVLQELIFSHSGNTSREANTNIRVDLKTGNNEHFSRGNKMVKGPSCKINYNL